MKINRVKYNGKTVEIDHETDKTSAEMTYHDRPLPEFIEAIEELAPLIATICEFPAAYWQDENGESKIEPTGFTITDKQEVRCVTFTAKRKVIDSHSPLNIATPIRYMEHPQTEGTISTPFTDKQRALVERAIEEAKRYVKGERAQGTLPLNKDEEADEEKKKDPNQSDLDLPGAERKSKR